MPIYCANATLIFTVNGVNHAPIANNDVKVTDENTPISGIATASDIDGNLNPNSFATIDSPANGTIVMNADGSYTYTPNLNFKGVDSVHYKVCDLGMPIYCANATLIFTVNAVNEAPIAVNDFNNTIENTSVSGSVLINDSDRENNGLTVNTIPTSGPSHGTIVLNSDGSYIYTPNAGFIGTDTIQYTVCDDGVPRLCSTALLIIEVRKAAISSDQKPVLNDDNVTATNDKPIIINVLANDYNPTGQPLSNPTIVGSTNGGSVNVNADGTITFTPDSGFVGTASFRYVVCNTSTPPACDTAMVTINVIKPTVNNIKPIAVDDASSTFRERPINGTVAANDYDLNPGQSLSFTLLMPTVNGTVILNADGTYTFTPNPGYVGPDRFTYQVCDNGTPVKCDTATVYITVFDLPKITPDSIFNTMYEEVTDTICLDTKELIGKNFTVNNVCPSTGKSVEFNVVAGTTCIETVAILKGEEKACFVVCDEFGFCDTTYINIKVLNINQGKRIKAKNDETSTPQGKPVTSSVVTNDSLSNYGLRGVRIIKQGRNGQAEVDSTNGNGNGNGIATGITYTPQPDFCGIDNVTYEICNAYGCDTAVVKIRVICDGLKVFNGFSPNGDGVNDYLVIDGLDKFPNHKLEIFNRWGNQVLQTKNYKNDWGGTWTDRILPDGTYFYIINDGEGHYYSGYIQIYRSK